MRSVPLRLLHNRGQIHANASRHHPLIPARFLQRLVEGTITPEEGLDELRQAREQKCWPLARKLAIPWSSLPLRPSPAGFAIA